MSDQSHQQDSWPQELRPNGSSAPLDRIEVIEDENSVIVAVSGEHDLAGRPGLLRTAVAHAFSAGSRVVVDLTDATFVDSSVLAVLVESHDRSQRDPQRSFAVVIAPASFPARVFEVTGMASILPTFATLAAAGRHG